MKHSTVVRSGRDRHLRNWLLTGASALALANVQIAYGQTALPAPPPPATTTGAVGSGDSNRPGPAGSPAPGKPAIGAKPVVAAPGSPTAAPATENIVVKGIRQSLANTQNIKRRSATIVDAITAEDIGALPDRSVTESLQRVPGVAISHFAAVNDPDHISPEGQNVVIRGLPYVESQFNGRDAFTASKGRAINFQDIPPELLSSVEVFKNQTADQIEGGIAGVVNLITRRPLDTTKDIYALSVDANYGDLAGHVTPEASGLISKQWETPAGRFGVLGSLSYSDLQSQQDSTKITSYTPRCDGPGCPAYLKPDANGNVGAPIAGLRPGEVYYIPTGGGISRQDFDRERKGFSSSVQWESPDRDLLATFQFLRTDTTETWTEHTFAVVEDTDKGQVVPVPGTGLTFDNNNILQTGDLTYFGNTGNGYVPANGIQQQEITRGVRESFITDDFSGHLAWQATDRLKFDFDAQYADSSSQDLDVGLYGSTWGNEQINTTGTFPQTVITPPPGARYSSFANPNANFWRAAIDHEDNNVGRELTFRADGNFDFNPDSFLTRVKFGARYADRTQTIRSDGYNWGNLSEAWNGGPVYASQLTPQGFGSYNFGSFLRGGSQSNQTIFGFLGNNALNYAQFSNGAQAIEKITLANGGFISWHPLGQRPKGGGGPIVPISQGGDGFHNIGEIADNNEKTTAAYVRLDYGSRNIADTRWTVDGNVGLRVVHTESKSNGATEFPSASSIFGSGLGANGLPICPSTANPPPEYNICANTTGQQQALIAFADGSSVLNSESQHFTDFLPSFNLRVSPEPDLQFRFAYSKAITRPSFNDLHNFTQFQIYQPPTSSVNNPIIGYQANAAGNPQLKPTRSENFDLSAEYYFSPVGFVSVTPFLKRLTNVYAVSNGVTSSLPTGQSVNLNAGQPGGFATYTNASGATETVVFSGTSNNNSSVTLKGVEFDYQQTYTFLPHPFNGLGLTANFSFIQAGNLAGQANVYAGEPGAGPLRFPGVSKYNANAALFYENSLFSARLAYTWRSKYLIVSQDVNYPAQPVYSGDVGQLDASLFYNLTRNIKLGVEATNLLDEVSSTYVQINPTGLEAIRGAFLQDRRFIFGLRAVY